MPKFRLSDDQLSEVIDLIVGEIADLRQRLLGVDAQSVDAVEWKHREALLAEALDILEDAV